MKIRLLKISMMMAVLLATQACLSRKPPAMITTASQNNPEGNRVTRNFDKYQQKRILDQIFRDDLSCDANESQLQAESQLRLLTVTEYEWTIADVFGEKVPLQSVLPAEQKLLGFRNNAYYRLLTAEHFEAYLRAAESVSAALLNTNLLARINCPQEGFDPSCAQRFLDQFGQALWRRPLTEADRQALSELYQGQSNPEALSQLIQAMLISSQFLYRHEIGENGRLNPWELASGISYGLWASLPDEELFAKAADGSLTDASVLTAQIQRLLQDPKARRGLGELADAWLGFRDVLNVNKDQNTFPEFQSATRQILAKETEDFFDHVVRVQSAGFSELFLADYTIGDNELANYYRASVTGDRLITFNPDERRGLLGHGSILATYSSTTETHPVKRGEFVMEHIFCDIHAPTPAGLEVQVPPPDPNATTRERFAIHTQDPACAGCHIKLDGVGFGMEDMDSIGRFRSIDQGRPVDASGEIKLLRMEAEQSFEGSAQLSSIIAQSKRAQLCYTVHWFRILHGRFEQESDICHIRKMGEEFHQQSQSTGELILNLLTHPRYLQRSQR